MKPPLFDYFDPSSPEETLALLSEYGDDARILAGGQTLGPMLNMRVANPGVVIDINRVADLDFCTLHEDGELMIGALARQSHLEDSAELRCAHPLIDRAIPHIAHRAIRNRGTVAGSLCHADPAAEWGALALALNADMMISSHTSGTRKVAATDFFQGLLTTAVEEGEMLSEIRIPAPKARSRFGFRELSRRHGDFAIVGVACTLILDSAGIIGEARMALFGVGETPLRSQVAEDILVGTDGNPQTFTEAARAAAANIDPFDDNHATADYRHHLTAVLVEEALGEAIGGSMMRRS